MATREASLLAECAARPHDDAPRTIWADTVGGERGELVMLQCGPREDRLWCNRRERDLLAHHGLAWSGLEGIARRVRYERGFVVAIEVDAELFIECADEIVERAPFVHSLTIGGVHQTYTTPTHAAAAASRLEAIVTLPAFAQIRALDLVDRVVELDYSWPDNAMRVLASTGTLARLTGLGVRYGMTAAGVMVLCNAEPQHLERLWLRDSVVPGDALRELAARAPRLAELDLDASPVDFSRLSLPNLATLILRNVHPGTVFTLASSDLARTITHLVIEPAHGHHDFDAPTLRSLSRFPKLRTLELRGVLLAALESLRMLTQLELPELRELVLAGWTHAQAALAEVVAHFAPQLERLDLRRTNRLELLPEIEVLVDEPLEVALLGARGDAIPNVEHPGPPTAPAWLVCENGPQAGRVWDLGWLGATNIRIGRNHICDVVLASASVARIHTWLQWRDGAFFVRDTQSTNGTKLAGHLIDADERLHDGVELVLGTVGLRFFTGDGAGARATACALRVATHEPLSGLPRAARAEAAWLRIANMWELERHYGHIAGDQVIRELARRLVAAAGEVELSSPQRNEFRVFPADRAPALAAACDRPVDHEGLMLDIRIETRPFG
jgi:hypothetical protein